MSPSTPPTSADHAGCAEFGCAPWFDAHNHLHDPRLDLSPDKLVAAQRAAGISGCVVNATCEDDWPRVAALARQFPGFLLPAFGIHPWKAQAATPGWQERLLGFLEAFPEASIGECGIDSWVHHPPLDIQTSVFLDHLRIARETGRFLSIHCLKAWAALFHCFDQQPPPSRFLLHSFSGSHETARRLLPLGARFSFSGHFLHRHKHQSVSVFRNLPPDRILLETDAPDMNPPDDHITHPMPNGANHPANLPAIGLALATELGVSPEALAGQTTANALGCFLAPQDSHGHCAGLPSVSSSVKPVAPVMPYQ